MACLLEQLTRDGSVTLEGYRHQVGGQFRLMKFGDCVCKPLYLRESLFYESLSEELKRFTAAYYGVVTVCFERQSSGEIKMVAYPRQQGGSMLNKKALKANYGFSTASMEERISVERDHAYMSPWCEQCTRVSTEKLNALGAELDTVQQEYIVLENLTTQFSRPSILDLKVGFGNHGDYDTEEKRLRHFHNKKNSTTGSLHVRVSGMQKYDAAQNEYIFRDKYYGRGLSEKGFREELRSFLHNGVQFRGDLLSDIIAMLEELVGVVERQDCYRFFSSSLLIIYDGAHQPEEGCGSVQTNGAATPLLSLSHTSDRGESDRPPNPLTGHSSLTDAAVFLPSIVNEASMNGHHTTTSTNPDSRRDVSQNNHLTNGESSHISHMTNGEASRDGHMTNGEAPHDGHMTNGEASHNGHMTNGEASHDGHMTNGEASYNGHMTNGDLKLWLTDTRKRVDIRMIDFVHGVHSSFGDPALSGCDTDYVHGLKALLTKFRELLRST